MKNDFREYYDEEYIMHDATTMYGVYGGHRNNNRHSSLLSRKWKKHKYLYIDKNGNYIYPEDIKNGIKTAAGNAVRGVKNTVSKVFKPDDPLTKMQKAYHRSMKKSAVKEFGRDVGNAFNKFKSDWYDESPGLQAFNKKSKSFKNKTGFVTGMIGKDIKRNISKNKKTYGDDIVGRLNKVVNGTQKDKQKMQRDADKINKKMESWLKKNQNATKEEKYRHYSRLADDKGYVVDTKRGKGPDYAVLTKYYGEANKSGKYPNRNKYRNKTKTKINW